MDKILLILSSILIGLTLILIQYLIQTNNLTNPIKFLNPSSLVPNKSSKNLNKPTFLICGINNSGKTSLFYKLTTGEFKLTISSIEKNIGEINLPFAKPSISKKFQIIDYPGHLKYWNLFKNLVVSDIKLNNIKGIIIVIDSSSKKWSNGSIEMENLIKFLYNLISITERKQNGIDYLFAVNKNDLFDSLPVLKIKSILESEINKLINNEINNINKTSGIDKETTEKNEEELENNENLREFWLSIIGTSQNFKFEKLEGNMDFIGGSILKNKIEKWEDWLDEKVMNP
ncbi:uncharacterized protein KGF55_003773 [Candida pseudojiufengensis]|uniref:uncharacterized protein n=1 Tax=Candida pseudojiufengensis TaxID=497109 RepID=UPI0022256974|nr:uncharacterized protein KGF55_003773 [Candida pseudojiufengensis]KAI5962697.1 hypothetical protein KGF55_003773 [Candida pseudojiufengensis]